MVTGSDFQSIRDSLQLAKDYPGTIFATAGIHPCSSAIFSSEEDVRENGHVDAEPVPDHHLPDADKSADILAQLTDLVAQARKSGQKHLVAMGEFGLDYDRLHYCNKLVQRHSFEAQLAVAAAMTPQLPLFLHSRAAHTDFVALLKAAFGDGLERLEKGGVVHSFTGTAEEMRELMDLGLHIGINGCSFKTAENCKVVEEIRLDRIMLETDGPWCEVRPSHEGWKHLIEAKTVPEPAGKETADEAEAKPKPKQTQSKKNQKKIPEVPDRFKVVKKEKWEEGAMVKGRNEPCNIERVAKVVAGIKGISVEEVCEAAWNNTVKVFGLGAES
ncbi:hypothetical protein RJ55_00666 [Drechmeria coniospora]|nr:hypothetical protein RJ55_00666 [Drechmeria coniospora]